MATVYSTEECLGILHLRRFEMHHNAGVTRLFMGRDRAGLMRGKPRMERTAPILR